MERRSSLGERLTELRAERHVSVQDAAEAVGVSRSYLSGIENNHDKPGREILVALANYYEVSLDWLTTGEGERRPPSLRAARLFAMFEALPPADQRLVFDLCESLSSRTGKPGPEWPTSEEPPDDDRKKGQS
jgi:transcriptional regulator with XRE-family HTH domain